MLYRLFIAIALCLLAQRPASLSESCPMPWPVYGHDPQHTCQSPYRGSHTPTLKWKFDIGKGKPIRSSPVIGPGGVVYIHSMDGNLDALSPDGTRRWTFRTGHRGDLYPGWDPSPAVGGDGTIYGGAWWREGGRDTGQIYALRPDGTEKWSRELEQGTISAPAIDPNDGAIYINDGSKMRAFYPDGSDKWPQPFQAGEWIPSSAALSPDGNVLYFGSAGNDAKVYALYAQNGQPWPSPWPFQTRTDQSYKGVEGSPSVRSDGTIYVGANDARLYALWPDGRKRWEFVAFDGRVYGTIHSIPAISPDESTVYMGSHTTEVWGIDLSTGQTQPGWPFDTGDNVQSSPAIGADGVIYIPSRNGRLFALRPDGSILWEYQMGFVQSELLWSSPAIAPDGTIYVGSTDGYLYALGGIDHLQISSVASPQTAGEPFTLTLTALDKNNNVVTDFAGMVRLSDLTGTIAPSEVGPFVNGIWTGQVTITAPLSRDLITVDDCGGHVTTSNSFDVEPGALYYFRIVPDPAAQPKVDQPFSITITAEDRYGHPTTKISGEVLLSVDVGTITPPSISEDGFTDDGVWTGEITLTGAGWRKVSAKNGAVEGVRLIKVEPGSLHHLRFESIPSPQTAGKSFWITVFAEDIYGNRVTDFNTDATLSDKSGTMQPTTARFYAGQLRVQVTVTKAMRDDTITVRTGDLAVESNTFDVEPNTVDHFRVEVPSQATAGEPFRVILTAQDASGNAVTTFTGPVALQDTTGTVAPTVIDDFDGGVGTGTVTITQARADITLTANDGQGHTGTSDPFDVEPNRLDHFQVELASSATAGEPFTATITAEDAYNNTTIRVSGPTALSADAGSIVPTSLEESEFTERGIWTGEVRLTRAGTRTITARNGDASGEGKVEIRPASLDHFLCTPISSPQVAGEPFDLALTAQDAYENTVTAFSVSVILRDTTETIDPTATGNFTEGKWAGRVSVTKAQKAIVITIDNGQGHTGKSEPFDVEPNVLDHFLLELPSVATAGQPFEATVTAQDAWDNPTPQVEGETLLAVDEGEVAPASLVADEFADNGGWNGVLTLTRAGERTVGVTNGSVTAEGKLRIQGGLLADFRVDSPHKATADKPFSLTLTALDAWGNPTLQVSDSTKLSTDAGEIRPESLAASEFADDGVYTGTLTLTATGARTLTIANGEVTKAWKVFVSPLLNEPDPYADAVVSSNILGPNNLLKDPDEAVGAPNVLYESPNFMYNTVSLGGPGGFLVVDMDEGEEVVDGPGPDLKVYEAEEDEDYEVFVSSSPEGPWQSVGTCTGTATIEFGQFQVQQARYVRIEDHSSRDLQFSYPGSDIDAVEALNMEAETGLTVHVMRMDGSNLPGATVLVLAHGQPYKVIGDPHTTGSDGRCTIIGLAEGHYDVRAFKYESPERTYTPDTFVGSVGVEVGPDGPTPAEVTLHLAGPASELARKYAPGFYFHSEEGFFPTQVEFMLDHSQVEIDGKTYLGRHGVETLVGQPDKAKGTYLDIPDLGPGLDASRYHDLYTEHQNHYGGIYPTVYMRTATCTFQGKSYMAVQYWLFYLYNNGWVNNHEGDWEMVQLMWQASSEAEALTRPPDWVTRSYHGYHETVPWSSGGLEFYSDNEGHQHPWIYVAKGSHAAYFDNGVGGWHCEGDQTGQGTASMLGDYYLMEFPPWGWGAYWGHWGQEHYLPGFSGPGAPVARDGEYTDDEDKKYQWSNPAQWALTGDLHPFRTGLTLISLPFQPSVEDPAALFGLPPDSFKWAWWNPNLGIYEFYTPNEENGAWLKPREEVPGKGYWLYLDPGLCGDTYSVRMDGLPVSTETCSIALCPSWNPVGNPYLEEVPWDYDDLSRMAVRYNGTEYTLEDAALNGLLHEYAWAYNSTSGSYQLVYDPVLSGALHTLEAWRGYWVKAQQPCELVIKKPVPSAGRTSAESRSIPETRRPLLGRQRGQGADPAAWAVQLIARARNVADESNYFGVLREPREIPGLAAAESPPPVSPYVDLYFTRPARAAQAGRYATDLRPTLTGRTVWEFVVETDQQDADVILAWPDLSGVPREVGLTLVDVEANQRVYLRTRQHYVYRAGDAPRRFQIVAEPNVLGSLAITQFTVQPARGGLTLTYQLSRSAAVQAEVRTLAGREVAPIAADTRAEGGMNTLPWTAQDEQGRPLPDGVYLVCLTATTEEGQVVRAVRPVAINR